MRKNQAPPDCGSRNPGSVCYVCPMKLLSGGQSGVDRAVLDVALARGLAYGGWCPKGGWAEDYPTPPGILTKYPRLQQTPLADPAQRTEWNVRDADACLILVDAGGVGSLGGDDARKRAGAALPQTASGRGPARARHSRTRRSLAARAADQARRWLYARRRRAARERGTGNLSAREKFHRGVDGISKPRHDRR